MRARAQSARQAACRLVCDELSRPPGRAADGAAPLPTPETGSPVPLKGTAAPQGVALRGSGTVALKMECLCRIFEFPRGRRPAAAGGAPHARFVRHEFHVRSCQTSWPHRRRRPSILSSRVHSGSLSRQRIHYCRHSTESNRPVFALADTFTSCRISLCSVFLVHFQIWRRILQTN